MKKKCGDSRELYDVTFLNTAISFLIQMICHHCSIVHCTVEIKKKTHSKNTQFPSIVITQFNVWCSRLSKFSEANEIQLCTSIVSTNTTYLSKCTNESIIFRLSESVTHSICIAFVFVCLQMIFFVGFFTNTRIIPFILYILRLDNVQKQNFSSQFNRPREREKEEPYNFDILMPRNWLSKSNVLKSSIGWFDWCCPLIRIIPTITSVLHEMYSASYVWVLGAHFFCVISTFLLFRLKINAIELNILAEIEFLICKVAIKCVFFFFYIIDFISLSTMQRYQNFSLSSSLHSSTFPPALKLNCTEFIFDCQFEWR